MEFHACRRGRIERARAELSGDLHTVRTTGTLSRMERNLILLEIRGTRDELARKLKGYQIWAEAIQPTIDRYFGPR